MTLPATPQIPTEKDFFGMTTISEKGQVVIPAEARKALGLTRGEKLLVLRLSNGMLALAQLQSFRAFADQLSHFGQVVEAQLPPVRRNPRRR